MRVRFSMSCLVLAAALVTPAAMGAAELARPNASLLEADVPAMTDVQLQERLDKIKAAAESDDAAALRNALGTVAISGMAVSDEQVKTASDFLQALAAKYPKHADLIKTNLYRVENLTIGRIAPNIKGEGIDGKSMELAQYRGKVVVIDFFGDW
ncbi:MAG: hypothetical protein IT430_03445 [Phycisphaerales bacterium]|nr:hypothetical protein [Phycisphaerales bacterium]